MWAHIQYDEKQLLVKLQIFFIKIRVYPVPKWLNRFLTKNDKKDKRETSENTLEKPSINETDKPDEKIIEPSAKRDITPDLLLDVLSSANEALQGTMEVLSIKKLVFLYPVHGSDAATTAIKYGTFNAGFAAFYAVISNYFKEVQIKKVEFTPDFTDEIEQKIFFSCKIGTRPVPVIKVLLHLFKQLRSAKVI